MIAGCASKTQPYAGAAYDLALPPEVERPCELALMEEGGAMVDLEAAYMRRGQFLLQCDAARAMAVKILKEERGLRAYTYR